MPFPFSSICDLLEQAYTQCLQKQSNKVVVADWFTGNRHGIDAHDTDLSALLSTLFPEKRTDRVFCIKSPRLEKIVGRALCLGRSRMHELSVYKQPGSGTDLGDCLERILRATPTPVPTHLQNVTVEEIDKLLHELAAGIKWSSPAIRASQTNPNVREREGIESMYLRLNAREAKWFTRLILKSYEPLIFDTQQIYSLCHPSLPMLLRIQEDFSSAVTVAQRDKLNLLHSHNRKLSPTDTLLAKVKPKLGIKVGRQNWFKARSIKHCIDMAGRGAVSIERKIDGEYCQIHVDPTKGVEGIQIFSKSGKDSTEDREGLLRIISESLRIGTAECKTQKQCILEGELVVYNDLEYQIQPFHKIRQFVTRRGRYVNTEQDSRPNSYDHLMIVYYDILLLDDQSFLDTRRSERFAQLQRLIRCRPGFAELVQHQVVNLGSPLGAHHLRKAFARTIVSKEEGLVVKPDAPYFNFHNHRDRTGGLCIKLKKEYIGTFGDVGDFAVVGAGYDAVKAKSYPGMNVRWTRFYIGCLLNRDEVKQWKDIPYFKIVNYVDLNEAHMKLFVSHITPQPVVLEENTATRFELAPGVLAQSGLRMTHTFQSPPVFDIRCFSFEKVGNTGFWSMRFPTVSKIHFDRDYTDGITFDELQQQAFEAQQRADLEDSQENLRWIAELEAADPRGRGVDAASQVTVTTAPTPSPRQSTQTTVQSLGSPIQQRPSRLYRGDLEAPHLGLVKGVSMSGSLPFVAPSTSLEPARVGSGDNTKGFSSHTAKRQQTGEVASPYVKRQKSDRFVKPLQLLAPSQHIQSSPLQTLPDTRINVPSQRDETSLLDDSQENGTANKTHNNFKQISSKACFLAEVTSEANSIPAPQFGTIAQTLEEQSNDAADHETASMDDNETAPESNGDQQTDIQSVNENVSAALPKAVTREGSTKPSAAVAQGQEVDKSPRVCQFVGDRCRFSRYRVIIPPFLLPLSEELQNLCEEHGIDPVTKSAKMFGQERRLFKAGQRVQERGRILLVDAIRKPMVSQSYVTWLGEKRAGCELLTAWVNVFDWRVLKAWSMRENPEVGDTNREFFDAHRRFQVAII